MATLIDQIAALETAAGTAGDLLQVALCQIVLSDVGANRGDVRDATWDALSDAEQQAMIKRYGAEHGGSDIWVEGGREWRILQVADECERVIGEVVGAK